MKRTGNGPKDFICKEFQSLVLNEINIRRTERFVPGIEKKTG